MYKLATLALLAMTSGIPQRAISQRVDMATSVWFATGNAATGSGVGVAVDGRRRLGSSDWLTLVTSIAATSMQPVSLPLERSMLRAAGYSASVSVGPELSLSRRGVRPHVRVLSGVARVSTQSTFTPSDVAYDFGTVSAFAPYLEFGGGIAVPVSQRVRLDVGARRALTGSTVWARNPQGSFDGQALPDLEYRRRLDAIRWFAGVRFGRHARQE